MSLMGGSRFVGIGLCLFMALACGHKPREVPRADEHSRWLQSCDADSDCGALECICGLCTRACAADSGCSTVGASAVCESGGRIAAAGKCQRAAESISVCLPACRRDSDCEQVADGLVCDDGLCQVAPTSRPAVGDAGSDDAGLEPDVDAGSDTPRPVEDAPPSHADELDCDSIAANVLPAGLTLLDSFPSANPSLLATDAGDVYGTRGAGAPTQEIWQRSEPAGPPRILTSATEYIQVLAVDGDELFFGTTGGDGSVVVSKVPVQGGTVLHIARESGYNVTSILIDRTFVYWLADDGDGSSGVTRLLRSEREPGTTQALASVGGQSLQGSLQRVGDTLYFAMNVPPAQASLQMQIYVVGVTGDGPPTSFGPPAGISALASDGTQLFAHLINGRDRLGNATGESGIARVSLNDGSFELIFPDEAVSFGALTVDATDVFWISGMAPPGAQVWRGDKRGKGKPVRVAHGFGGTTVLTQDSSSLYWTVQCGTTDHVIRAAK